MLHDFQDTRYMSKVQKTKVLTAWVRFLKGGLQFSQFTEALYDHLIQHCSFIAHYSRAGFYSHYFEDGDSTALFLSQFDLRGPRLSVEYGGRYWLTGDHKDLNRAMIEEAKEFIPSLAMAAYRKQQAADITKATALFAKHGLRCDVIEQGTDQPRPNCAALSQGLLFEDTKERV